MPKMKLLSRLQDKLELYRLEQKYTRRKNRSTFTTGAQYVDGEYVYSSTHANFNPASTTSSPTSQTSYNALGRDVGSAEPGPGQNAANRDSKLWGR